MIEETLNIILVVDTSITDRGVIEAIKENVKEVLSELQGVVNGISLISFGNTPNLIKCRESYDSFDVKLIPNPTGGMCNIHLALRSIGHMPDDLQGKTSCILLFLCSDPTDSDRVLDENTKELLTYAEKYLIKRSSYLLEPRGFEGSRMYLLGSEQDLRRLIGDIRNESGNDDSSNVDHVDEIEEYSSRNISSEGGKMHLDNKGNPKLDDAEVEEKEDALDITIYFEDEDLPSPEIYT